MLERIAAFGRAHHPWFSAAGLAGLALYHASRGQWADAGSWALSAAGLLGLHLCPSMPEPPELPDPPDDGRNDETPW